MIALGYLLVLALCALIVTLARLQLARAPGGDAGYGYAWAMLAGHTALLLLLLALTGVVAVAGRLPTTSVAWSTRALPALLFVGVVGAVAAAMAVAAPTAAVAPLSVAGVTRLLPLLVPLLITITAGVLLRGQPPGAAPGPWPARLLGVAALQAALFAGVLALPTVRGWLDVQRAMARRGPDTLDRFQQQVLDGVEALDPATQFARLLAATRDGNHRRIRERALARIRSLPDWEARVTEVLSGPGAEAAFVFLASRDVRDATPYAGAAATGIRTEAARVRARIRNASHPSHLYEGLMASDVDRLLAAVAKMSGAGVDHAPALRELRAAFAEPAPWPHPRYHAVDAVDRWLRARR